MRPRLDVESSIEREHHKKDSGVLYQDQPDLLIAPRKGKKSYPYILYQVLSPVKN